MGGFIYKDRDFFIPSSKPITWARGKVYALGALFSTSEINESSINFREKIEKMKKIMSSWSARNLTLLGKILKSLVQYCAKVMQTKFGEFRSSYLANFRAQFRVKLRKISGEKFQCQTIFRAKFQGNIARYFRRTNEKSPFRNFAEAKFRAATNKLMSNKMKQFKYGKVTEM